MGYLLLLTENSASNVAQGKCHYLRPGNRWCTRNDIRCPYFLDKERRSAKRVLYVFAADIRYPSSCETRLRATARICGSINGPEIELSALDHFQLVASMEIALLGTNGGNASRFLDSCGLPKHLSIADLYSSLQGCCRNCGEKPGIRGSLSTSCLLGQP